jgi:hypothetical protein
MLKEIARMASLKDLIRSIYLAGAYSENGWRHLLVSGFADQWIDANDIPILEKAIFGRYNYVGPYRLLVPLDDREGESKEYHEDRITVAASKFRMASIDKADLLFAWITENSTCETVAEMAFAAGRGKVVLWAIPRRLLCTDLYKATLRATAMSCTGTRLFDSPRVALADILKITPEEFGLDASYVYFIRSHATSHIKIGFAADLKRRLQDLQTGSPSRL